MDEQMPRPSSEDLDRGAGEKSPDHASPSPIGANVAIPVNAEVAANVLSSSAEVGNQAASESSRGER